MSRHAKKKPQHIYSDIIEKTYETPFPILMRRVFIWLTLAISVSFFICYILPSKFLVILYNHGIFDVYFWVICLLEISFPFLHYIPINRFSKQIAVFLFIYFIINTGLFLDFFPILEYLPFLSCSFLVAAIVFATMALLGDVTNVDITSITSRFFMVLSGAVITCFMCLLFECSYFYACILINVIYTTFIAFGMSKIKKMFESVDIYDEETIQKYTILAALFLCTEVLSFFITRRALNKGKNRS